MKRKRTPLDLMAIYLSPGVGIGQRMRIATVDRELAKLPLVPVLVLLAQINFRADATDPLEARIEFARTLLPPVLAEQAVAAMRADPRFHVTSSQVVTRLAFRALVHCDDRPEAIAAKDLTHRIGSLLLSYAGIVETMSDSADAQDLSLEIVRLELWYRLRDYDRWYEVAHRVIFEVLPTLRDHADWLDARQILENSVGMSLELFWALTTSYGIAVANDPDCFRFPKYTDTAHVSNEDVDRWDAFWSTSISEAQRAAAADLAAGQWSFSTFYNKPLLELTNESSIVVRPWFLANKATPAGFYSTIENLLGSDRDRTGKWARLFGQAIDQFGRILMQQHCSGVDLLADEAAIRASWGEGAACDAVLLGDDWLAVDFVHRRISRETGTTGDFTSLAKDIRIGVVDKLEQIDATLYRGVSTVGNPPGKMYPLVVIGAPFPVNGPVLNEIDRMHDATGPKVVGVDRVHCAPPAIMDIGEFWMLLELAEIQKIPATSLIEQWLSSNLGIVSFRNWLATEGPGQPPVPAGHRRYARHARRHLFGVEA